MIEDDDNVLTWPMDRVERYIATLADNDAKLERAVEAAAANRPAPDDFEHWMRQYAEHAFSALVEWADWHVGRALDRSLVEHWNEAVDLHAVSEAAGEVFHAVRDGQPDAAIDEMLEALHGAITEAKEAAEGRRLPPTSTDPRRVLFDHQAEEIETSHLRGWARVVAEIELCRRGARDEPKRATAWQLQAAHALAFAAPPLVMQVDE
jgi:hypothetical protein